ncbi:MAG: GDYXXLXY domain-containing protein [Elusimicrobia bacterium]|nr:GDYXXLXY domain-containing protein [Elusimicrobiota bacterium]
MSRLRVILLLQLLFFMGWASYLFSSRDSDSPEFYLETAPVDPRDILSGTYVALNYDISRPGIGDCSSRAAYGPVYVKLEHKGKTARTETGKVQVYEATDCRRNSPQEQGWAAGSLQYSWGGNAVKYGIEKFFLNENDPRKDLHSGTSVLAKVKIGSGRRLVLLDLVKKV